jgi:hypothetical protein
MPRRLSAVAVVLLGLAPRVVGAQELHHVDTIAIRSAFTPNERTLADSLHVLTGLSGSEWTLIPRGVLRVRLTSPTLTPATLADSTWRFPTAATYPDSPGEAPGSAIAIAAARLAYRLEGAGSRVRAVEIVVQQPAPGTAKRVFRFKADALKRP